MNKSILSVIVMFLAAGLCGMAQSPESDRLFAIGVEKYNAGQYNEAIGYFEQVDSIDTAELDSLSPRSGYGKAWLASCWYKIGDVEKAKNIDIRNYYLPPIDRRLTVESDSLQELAFKTFQEGNDAIGAIAVLQEVLAKESATFGEDHYWLAGTLNGLAVLSGNTGNPDKSIEYMNRCIDLSKKWYNEDYDDSPDYLYMSQMLLSNGRFVECWEWLWSAEESVLKHHGIESIQYENVFSIKLYLLAVNQHWNEAEKLVKEYRKIVERRFGKNSVEEKSFLLNIANFYNQSGRIKEAGYYRNESSKLKNYAADENIDRMNHLHSELDLVNNLIAEKDNKKAIKKLNGVLAETKNRTDSISRTFYWTAIGVKSMVYSLANKRNPEPLTYGDYLQSKEELGEMSFMVGFFYALNYMLFKNENYSPEENERALSVLREVTPTLLYYTQNDPISCAGNMSQLALMYAMIGQVTESRKYSSEATTKYMGLIENPNASHSYDRLSNELKNQITTIKYHIDEEDNRYFSSNYGNSLHHDSISYAGHKLRANMLECKLMLDLKIDMGKYSIRSDASDYYVDMGLYCGDSIHSRAFMSDYMKKLADKFGKEDDVYTDVGYYYAQLFKKGSKEGREVYEELLSIERPMWRYMNRRLMENYYEFIDDKEALVRLRVDEISEDDEYALPTKFRIYEDAGMKDDAISAAKEYLALFPDKEIMYVWYSSMIEYLLLENPEAAYESITEMLDKAELIKRNKLMIELMCNILAHVDVDKCSEETKNGFRQFIAQQIENRQTFNADPSLRLHLNLYQALMFHPYDDKAKISDILTDLYVSALSKQIENPADEAEIIYTYGMWNAYHSYGQMSSDYLRSAIAYFEANEGLDNTAEYKTLLIVLSGKLSVAENAEELLTLYDKIANTAPTSRICTDFIEKHGLSQDISEFYVMNQLRREYKEEIDFDKYTQVLEANSRVDDLKPMLVKTLRNRLNEINTDLKRSYVNWESTARNASELCGTIAQYAEMYSDVDSLAILAYDASMLCKGMLLRAEGGLYSVLATSDNASISEKFNKMQSLKTQLDEARKNGEPTEEIQQQYNRARSQMVDQANRLGNFTSSLQFTSRDVARKLSGNDVAVEFLSHKADSLSVCYAAVLIAGRTSPKILRLCTGKELQAASSPYATDEIYQLIWRPIEELIRSEKPEADALNIYFAPTGALHQLAVEYVPMTDGRLISQRHNIYRLSNTAELLKDSATRKKESNPAMLYGGIIYDEGNVPVVVANGKRGAIVGIEYLPGTEEEVRSIGSELEGSDYDVTVVTGNDATEMSVKELSGSGVSVLHLATHGFYNPEKADSSTPGSDDPLIHSGLYMAGASGTVTGFAVKPADEDGILTAKDIAELDFSDADLVVLSACQTALGEVSDEGVFGLQRGFKKAGVNSLLMSLWPVDDEATRVLMTRFYSNLASGMGKREALQESQSYLRLADDGYFDDPEYWAAFILLDAVR